jgi:hypothetical protein
MLHSTPEKEKGDAPDNCIARPNDGNRIIESLIVNVWAGKDFNRQ